MTQHLWFVRRKGAKSGPFPANQLRETFRLGQLDLKDEVSLDGQQWLKLRETDILDTDHVPVREPVETDEDWRREREKAKLRWISDAVETADEELPAAGQDEVVDRLRRHEAETREMLNAQTKRRPAFVAGLATVLVLMLIGVGVWLGQSGETMIQATPVSNVPNCKQPPGEGVQWAGCGKGDSNLSGAVLRNGNLNGIHLGRANLSGADLSYANLVRADLRGANLQGAILKGATLAQADLTGADLAGADLSFAVLTGASVGGVRLDGASLRQSTWVDGRTCGDQSVGACQ